MGNETLYRKALEDLNSIHNGDDTFEHICHVLALKMLPEYNFSKPAGGNGRKDGGRDGIDYIKKTRMACSINEKYSKKIFEEIQKKGEEECLFYFSNQAISEPEKIKYEKEYTAIISLRIYSIENLVQEIDKLLSSELSPELYALLRLSFLINGGKINRGDIKKKEINIELDGLYAKKITIKRDTHIEDYPASVNPLADFIFTELEFHRVDNFAHVFLKGIGNIGKTTIMKLTYNSIIDSYKDNINKKFLFSPLPFYFDLKHFTSNLTSVPNTIDPIIFFLDGLDELLEEKKNILSKEIGRVIQDYPNVKFIISGRDASFISEISNVFNRNYIELKLEKYIDANDVKLNALLNKYKGFPIYDLLPLPIFREFAQSHSIDNNISQKTFYEELIRSKLQLDKKKYDEAHNITKRTKNTSSIDIDYVLTQLSLLCYSLFCRKERIFSEKDLNQYFDQGESNIFLIESSLLDYLDEKHISFVSNYYYEYFIANYFSRKKLREITQAFFIQNSKDIKVSTLNIFTILLSILDKKSFAYREIEKKLSKISTLFILLTDFETLKDDVRFQYYQSIIEQLNAEKRQIYYARFTSSHNLLAMIPSLSDSLRQLLPVSFLTDAVRMLINEIESFLKEPEEDNCVSFSNSVILLGVYGNPFWNKEQQESIEQISIPLIQFFLRNKLSDKLKGLLSEDIILDWYETYHWTNDWKDSEWNTFIQSIQNNDSTIDSAISSESEFQLKLKLFNIFVRSNVRTILRNSLLFYMLSVKENNTTIPSLSVSPTTLDDTYETPMLHFNSDIVIFNKYLEKEDIDINTLLSLFSLIVKYNTKLDQSSEFEISGIYHILVNQLIKNIPEISETQCHNFYGIFIYLIHPRVSKLTNINELNMFRDSVKIVILERIQKDLGGEGLISNPFLDRILYSLLNIQDRAKAEEILRRFDTDLSHNIYISLIWLLHNKLLENHILYDKGEQCYPLFFQEQIKRDKEKQRLLEQIDDEEATMLLQEAQLLVDKDLLVTAINKVFNFIDNEKCFKEHLDESAKYYYLEADRIKSEIQYDSDYFVTIPTIFSNFVLKLLRSFAFYNEKKEVNRERLYSYINDCLDTENNYWLFFHDNFVMHYPQENVMRVITDNPNIFNKISISMHNFVLQQLKSKSTASFDEGMNREWVAPFANCIHVLFDDKPQDWLDKEDALKFCSFPGPFLQTNGGAFTSGQFAWGQYSNIFQWLERVFLLDRNTLLTESYNVINLLKGDISRAQIFDFLIQNINNDVISKGEIINLIIRESKKNIYSNTNSSQSHVLGLFWRQYNDNHVNEILDLCNVKNLSIQKNICLQEMLNYICRVGDTEQKKEIITQLKNNLSNQYCLAFLCQLGYDKAVIKTCDSFLRGINVVDSFEYLGFRSIKRSRAQLLKYIQLYIYSLEKNNDRRQILLRIAQIGISNNITKKNFSLFNSRMQRVVQRRKIDNNHFEFIEDYVNEVKQTVFNT